MPAKLRLQRFGKKGHAYYHIVVADSRAPRDGKFIERIGSYNPNTNPATIDVNIDKAISWLGKGAQPSDTVRAMLSYKGVLYKKHLQEGVKKGAITEEAADSKFEEWNSKKQSRIETKKSGLVESRKSEMQSRLSAEKAKKESRAKAIAKKYAPPAEEPAQETPAESAAPETPSEASE